MGNVSNVFSLFFILAFSSLFIIPSVYAQTIPAPSIPEFNIRYIPSSYSVTTVDPYTGQSVTKQYDNNTIELSIINQQYTYSNGSTFYVYYNIRTKGHFEQNWTELYPLVKLLPNSDAYKHANYEDYCEQYIAYTAEKSRNDYSGLPQTGSAYTTITLPSNFPVGGIVDFQVEAIVGCNSTYYDPRNNIIYDPEIGGNIRLAIAYVISSGWSNTQTLNISDGSITTDQSTTPSSSPTSTALSSQNPTATLQQQNAQSGVLLGLGWDQIAIVALGAIVVVLAVALVFSLRRSAKRIRALSNSSVV